MQHPSRSGGFPALASSLISLPSSRSADPHLSMQIQKCLTNLSVLSIIVRSHLRRRRFASRRNAARTRTATRMMTRTKPITARYSDRAIDPYAQHQRRSRARATISTHTVVPAQTRRGNWEILRTDGSGSRLVLLLLLRPLAPSIVHTVRSKSAEKETRIMRGRTLRRIVGREREGGGGERGRGRGGRGRERRAMADEDAGVLDRLPRVPEEKGRAGLAGSIARRRGVDRVRVGFADFLSASVRFPALLLSTEVNAR
jgi:hypothetical protein